MAIRKNPITGEWEDDGTGVVNPPVAAGAPFAQPPADDVSPSDLVTAPTPLPITPGGVTMGLLSPDPMTMVGIANNTAEARAHDVEDMRTQAQADALASSPPLAPITSVPAPAPTPPKPKTGGGGGGGPSVEKQLRGDLTRVQTEQEALAKQQGQYNENKANAESKAADAKAKLIGDAEVRRAKVEQLADAEVAKQQAKVDAESEKYRNMGFRDFWADKTTGARVLGAIAVALGAAGASLTKGPNYAMEIIDRAIDRDYQRQRDAILKQKDVVTEARQGVEAARQAKADKLISLETWRKNAYEKAEAEAKAQVAKLGVEPDKSQKGLLTALAEKKLESGMAVEKGIAQIANTRADTALKYAEAARVREAAKGEKAGAASAGELGAASDAAGILTNLEQIAKLPQLTQKDLAKVNTNRTLLQTSQAKGIVGGAAAIAGKATGIVPNSETEGLDAKKQQAYLAWQNVRSSMAHVLTGSGMSDSEREDYIRRYTPQPGDTDSTIAAKFITARQFVKDSLIKAGRAAPQVQQRLDQLPAPGGGQGSAAGKPQRIRLRDGREATLGPDGQYYPVAA